MIEPQNTHKKIVFATVLALVLALLAVLLIFKGSLMTHFTKVKPLDIVVSSGTVKDGDIMTTILNKEDLPPDLVTKVQAEIGKTFNLRRMKPGHHYEVFKTTTGVFTQFVYHDDPTHCYSISRSSMGVFNTVENSQETVWKEKVVTCEVKNFLYKDLMSQGLSENFVANFIGELGDNIFPWQIDFFTEQRPGDVIEVLYQQESIVGSQTPLNRIRILAATYIGKGTRKKENYAYRFRIPGATKDDYFDKDGNAIRKAFLRAPFTYGNFRISSSYNPHRFHPILRVYRPHHGTDYAAPIGTRVSSIGKGAVIYAGWKSGYGNCVEIRHNSTYVSRYGHLSKVGVRVGQSVDQGRYVGNVGNTGLSTGPHLHFEMLVNGTSRNFVKMDFPSASSVPNDHLSDFKKVRDDLMDRLSRAMAAQPAAKQAQAQPPANQSTN